MAVNGKLMLADVPEAIQRELFAELAPKFRRSRSKSSVSKEDKVRAAATVLQAVGHLTLPQQRAVLLFAVGILDTARDRWWRDKTLDGRQVKKGAKCG